MGHDHRILADLKKFQVVAAVRAFDSRDEGHFGCHPGALWLARDARHWPYAEQEFLRLPLESGLPCLLSGADPWWLT